MKSVLKYWFEEIGKPISFNISPFIRSYYDMEYCIDNGIVDKDFCIYLLDRSILDFQKEIVELIVDKFNIDLNKERFIQIRILKLINSNIKNEFGNRVNIGKDILRSLIKRGLKLDVLSNFREIIKGMIKSDILQDFREIFSTDNGRLLFIESYKALTKYGSKCETNKYNFYQKEEVSNKYISVQNIKESKIVKEINKEITFEINEYLQIFNVCLDNDILKFCEKQNYDMMTGILMSITKLCSSNKKNKIIDRPFVISKKIEKNTDKLLKSKYLKNASTYSAVFILLHFNFEHIESKIDIIANYAAYNGFYGMLSYILSKIGNINLGINTVINSIHKNRNDCLEILLKNEFIMLELKNSMEHQDTPKYQENIIELCIKNKYYDIVVTLLNNNILTKDAIFYGFQLMSETDNYLLTELFMNKSLVLERKLTMDYYKSGSLPIIFMLKMDGFEFELLPNFIFAGNSFEKKIFDNIIFQ